MQHKNKPLNLPKGIRSGGMVILQGLVTNATVSYETISSLRMQLLTMLRRIKPLNLSLFTDPKTSDCLN